MKVNSPAMAGLHVPIERLESVIDSE